MGKKNVTHAVFKAKVNGALQVFVVSFIHFFGVKLWSRLSIIMGIATWLCYTGKISGMEWFLTAGLFVGVDFSRSKWLKGNGEGGNGPPVIDKIKKIVMGSE